MEAKTGAVVTRSYDDFEPFCEWQREEGRETLAVHLPDFKKDQLKVNVNNAGLLKITGEHPINETQSSRFIKEIRIPKTCNVNDVHAKFVGGVLSVIMPKKNSLVATQDQLALATQDQPPPVQQSQENGKPKPEIKQDKVTEKPEINQDDKVTEKPEINQDDKVTETPMCRIKPTKYRFGLESSVSMLTMNKKLTVNVVAVVAVVVAVGAAYATFKYRSSHVKNN